MALSNGQKYDLEKRQLRLAIARSRRRVDREIRQSASAARHLTSWQTYVRRYPASALGVGLGFGWLLSAGLRPRILVKVFGGMLTRRLSNQLRDLLWQEVRGVWQGTSQKAQPTAGGDRND